MCKTREIVIKGVLVSSVESYGLSFIFIWYTRWHVSAVGGSHGGAVFSFQVCGVDM